MMSVHAFSARDARVTIDRIEPPRQDQGLGLGAAINQSINQSEPEPAPERVDELVKVARTRTRTDPSTST